MQIKNGIRASIYLIKSLIIFDLVWLCLIWSHLIYLYNLSTLSNLSILIQSNLFAPSIRSTAQCWECESLPRGEALRRRRWWQQVSPVYLSRGPTEIYWDCVPWNSEIAAFLLHIAAYDPNDLSNLIDPIIPLIDPPPYAMYLIYLIQSNLVESIQSSLIGSGLINPI